LEVHLLERIVGLEELKRVEPIRKGEKIRLNVGTALTQGDVVNARKDTVTIKLDIPVCAEEGARVAISRYIARRGWRLIGYGFIK
ncbi:MAG: translation initiation factor IF-2 subunit gamma, partial [Thermoproteales archaeon]|nr:translation initiation factor IF-2 subunit gamma [Thermoproteales archaeon]